MRWCGGTKGIGENSSLSAAPQLHVMPKHEVREGYLS